MQLQAWRELQLVKDEDVDHADGYAVSQMLTAWAYFSRFWEQGKDGPANPLPLDPPTLPDDVPVVVKPRPTAAPQDGSSNGDQPAVKGAGRFTRRQVAQRPAEIHDAPRHNPLDESLDL